MRLIDADALIAWIKGSQQMTSKMKAVIAKIKTMQTTNAVSEWTPCSERLPTWGHSYCLITYANDYSTDVLIDCWDDEGKGWCDHQGCDGEVIAWMPLPKPWKGADDENR